MIAPLDPVIAQIIPLLPLRDPETMTPQSARDQLRALAASRAAIPPPPCGVSRSNMDLKRSPSANHPPRQRLSRIPLPSFVD